MSDDFSLIEFYNKFPNEDSCVTYLAKKRWGETPVCPICGSVEKIYYISSRRIYKCGSCKNQFTVRVGTIFEDSKMPLQKWFFAIYLATSLKKGISSIQLSKYLKTTQKTAWFMLHRIRYAISNGSYDVPMDGDIEIDETYMGGKAQGKRGRGANNKTPIVGIVNRNGNIRTFVTHDTKSITIFALLKMNVCQTANVYTDDYKSYKSLTKLGYSHKTIHHSAKQYVNGMVHTNTIEGYWSQLKRGINGINHWVSKKHLSRYCSEYEYRYNTRQMNDSTRFDDWFKNIQCKLPYYLLIK